MKRYLASFVMILALLVSTLFSSNTVQGAADVEKPELVSISIDKTKVYAGDDINITAKVSDKGGSGIEAVIVRYIMPITNKSEVLLLNKVNDTTFTHILNTSDKFEEGLWKLDSVLVVDEADNSAHYFDTQSRLAVFKEGVKDFSHMFFDFIEKRDGTNVTPPATTEIPTTEMPQTAPPTVDSLTTEKPIAKPIVKVSKPVISNKFIGDNTTIIKGTADSNATIYAVANGNFIGSSKVSSGKFSIKIASQKAGTNISFYAYSKKKKSSKVYFTVVDKTAPKVISINKVTTKSKMISGKGEANATAFVYNGKKLVGTTIVSSNKSFTVKIKSQKRNTQLSVYLVDKSGNKSKVKIIKVA